MRTWKNTLGYGTAIALAAIAGTASHALGQCEWSGLSTGVSSGVFGLGTYDGTLLVGGQLNTAGGDPANNVVRWDGQQWNNVANFTYRFTFSCCTVNTMAVYDNELHIGGTFDTVGGTLATFIAKWDGQNWAGLGPQFEHASRDHRGVTGIVHSMVVHDEGQGPVLFVAGGFTRAGDTDANRIARWDGQEWSDVGGSVTQATGQNSVGALAVFDGDLYAGGRFNEIGNVAANRIARWDGELWWDVGGGLSGSFTYYADSLAVFDDGRGEALYVGGTGFDMAGAVPVNRIARWDGQTWEPLGDGELNISDFLCFIDEFAVAQTLTPSQQETHYANCTGATSEPFLSVADFLCFIDEFAQGCP